MTEIELDKLRRQRTVLARFGGHALRTDNLNELLQEATALVSEAIEVDLVKVLELLPDGKTMLVRAGVNWNPGVVGHATFGADTRSPGGYALRTDQPVISRDVAREDRFEIPALLTEHGVKSMVNVVIRGERAAFGVLEVDSRRHRNFDEDDISFLQGYAHFIAAAIDRLETHRQLTELAKGRGVLLREFRHRGNNLLMNIRALARRTCAASSSLEEFLPAFDSRLAALGRTQDLLAAIPDAVTVRNILIREMEAHGIQEGEHIFVAGPDLPLSSGAVQALALAFHELMTNAVKYGALRYEAGKIDVTWDVQPSHEGAQVLVRWREHGVDIHDVPSRKGFGSQLIEKDIPQMLGGVSTLRFDADGIECTFSFPAPPVFASSEV